MPLEMVRKKMRICCLADGLWRNVIGKCQVIQKESAQLAVVCTSVSGKRPQLCVKGKGW